MLSILIYLNGHQYQTVPYPYYRTIVIPLNSNTHHTLKESCLSCLIQNMARTSTAMSTFPEIHPTPIPDSRIHLHFRHLRALRLLDTRQFRAHAALPPLPA